MDKIDNFKCFINELDLISDKGIRCFVHCALDETGDWFFKDPASTTGKNHPYFASGYGGLVRHTRAVVYFMKSFLETKLYNFDQHKEDLLIAASILHDIRKHTADGKYVENHARAGYEYILELAKKFPELISNDDAKYIADVISTHMGVWGEKQGERVPSETGEILLHMADYCASRKEIDIRFL